MFNMSRFHESRRSSFGSEFYYFHSIDSTNIFAEIIAREGCPPGTVIAAGQQTAGKGRNRNQWYSPPDVNLYFTVVLFPDLKLLHYIPLLCGLTVVRTLEHLGLKADLKWPNDVLVNDKKICGILVNTSFEENRLMYAVAGWGINVNAMDFPPSIQASATSMVLEKNESFSFEQVLADLLFEFETLYERIKGVSWEEFVEELGTHSSYLNDCAVTIAQDGKTVEGITRGLDSRGGLIIENEAGRFTIYSGNVQTCRKK